MIPMSLMLTGRAHTHSDEQGEDFHPNPAAGSQLLAPTVLLASLAWPFHQWPQAAVARCRDTLLPVIIPGENYRQGDHWNSGSLGRLRGQQRVGNPGINLKGLPKRPLASDTADSHQEPRWSLLHSWVVPGSPALSPGFL